VPSVQTSTPASRPSAPVSRSAASLPQPTQVRPSQHLAQQPAPQAARPLAAAAAPNLRAPIPAPPITNPIPQVAGNATAQPSSAVEIAALRARIAELESGNAHGNHLPARAPVPHQALVADPTTVDRIRASLSNSKEESKRPTLPALQPGHKVSALSLRKSCSHLFLCCAPCSSSLIIFAKFPFLSLPLCRRPLPNSVPMGSHRRLIKSFVNRSPIHSLTTPVFSNPT
jgi:hypothetical protein